LVDQHYCCAAHRKESKLVSAQALRDEEELELWAVSKSRKKRSSTTTAGQTASLFAFLTVAGLLVAALLMPAPSGGGSGPAIPGISMDPGVKRGFLQRMGDGVSDMIRSQAPITLHEDFHTGWTTGSGSGLADWTSATLHKMVDDPRGGGSRSVDDPRYASASAPVLRIWKRSTALQNYQMEFSGQLEKKSLSWAFRAADEKNYYATKIVITKPGPLPNAGLVRYAVMNGREWDRVQLPLPLTLERGGNYRIRMSIQDDRFITYLNGQVISSWSDKRLHRGGVGFFDDAEDPQRVAWVSVSERDSFLGRMLAHFSLIVMPVPPELLEK
ncbi:MAG TPA: hypothetical protein VKS01_10600, partial [Bryobacteraceae bacterium]|nr:hypothetical protein [Bryobacteraceae bacterium]